MTFDWGFYDYTDLSQLHGVTVFDKPYTTRISSIDELFERDNQREKDGFPRRVRAGRLIKPNAEHALKSPHAFSALFADESGEVARTLEIAGRCRFNLASLRYRYPSERLPDGNTSSSWLRKITMDGARKRYSGELPSDVVQQLDKELRLIDELEAIS